VFAAGRDRAALERIRSAWGFAATPVVVDLTRPGAFAEALRTAAPAVVFHLAGYGVDPGERDDGTMRRMNADLAGEIAEAVAALETAPGWAGLRLVAAGSAFEYGIREGVIDETTEPTPETPYGRTKLEGTRRIQDCRARRGLRGGTARLTTVYGPGEHAARLLPSLLRAARDGVPLDLTGGKQERDFTYVGDVAEGLLRIGTLPDLPEGVVNLATGRLSTVRSFVEAAREVLGIPADLLRLGAIPYRPDEVWQGPVSVGRLEKLTGWRPPTGVREGIAASREFLVSREGAVP
jgi:nucleoside-diphosphate-sugar epimerase